MNMGYGWGMGFGGFFMVIFWVLVAIGVIFLIKAVISGTKTEEKKETALDILKKRYAGGEISQEEFEKMKKEIT